MSSMRKRGTVAMVLAGALLCAVGAASAAPTSPLLPGAATTSDETPAPDPFAGAPYVFENGALDSGNVRAADAEARDLIVALSRVIDGVDPTATEADSAPTSALSQPPTDETPSLTWLNRTSWWTVAASADDVEDYLSSHAVHLTPVIGRETPGGWTHTAAADGTPIAVATYRWPGSFMAMPPSLVVTIQPAGDGTVVRADAVVDPRHGRPYEATVAKSSTGRVRRIAVVIDDQGVTWHRTLTDRGEIAEVVDAFNALPGVAMSSDPACGAMPAVPELRLTFRGARGTLLADDHTLACGGEQVIVSGKDGAIRPALDGDVSASFREDVERMVGFDNERASATESGALLDALDASLATMTSAGVRYDSSPNADLAKPGSTSSMGEPALTRTAWWTVPLSSDAVVASLKAHLPAGYTTAGGGSWGSMSWGKTGGTMITVADALLFGPSSDAYAAPQIDLEIEDVDGGSIVRADTYISPRAAPSPQSRVAGPVSRIGVVSHTTTWGTKIATTTRRYAVTDRPTISRFVTALNAAPGVSLYPGVWNCPAANSEIRLVLTLRTGTGSVVVHAVDAACGWGAVTVSRGGVQQGPALDVEGLAALLRQIGERR